jgi:putative endonuclease
VEGFSKKYKLCKLVYYEISDSIETAINREKFIKGKSRQYKINLIEENNKQWKDLYNEIIQKNLRQNFLDSTPRFILNGIV